MESSPEAEFGDGQNSAEGSVYMWKFPGIEPDTEATASYVVLQDDPSADPRKLQSVYKG